LSNPKGEESMKLWMFVALTVVLAISGCTTATVSPVKSNAQLNKKASEAATAEDYTKEQQYMVGYVYGQVQGLIASMDYMKEKCGKSGADLPAVWKTRNAISIARTDTLINRYIIWAANKSATPPDRLKALLHERMLKLTLDRTTPSFVKFDSSAPNVKATICKKFARQVEEGDWDVKVKFPSVYAYLSSSR
jgi:hypothetical protein